MCIVIYQNYLLNAEAYLSENSYHIIPDVLYRRQLPLYEPTSAPYQILQTSVRTS